MEKLLQRFSKGFGKEVAKTQSEKYYHKKRYLLYYSNRLKNGDLEFWAHPQYKEWKGEFTARSPVTYKKSFYLGRYKNGEMTKADDFYSFEMSVQRGAFKAFQMEGIYE